MARDTKQPELLSELFAALGNDPFVMAECLARPILVDRLPNRFTEALNSSAPQSFDVSKRRFRLHVARNFCCKHRRERYLDFYQ